MENMIVDRKDYKTAALIRVACKVADAGKVQEAADMLVDQDVPLHTAVRALLHKDQRREVIYSDANQEI